MKRNILSVCCLLAAFVGAFASSVNAASDQILTESGAQADLVCTYADFKDLSVSLVFQSDTGRVMLRIKGETVGDDLLNHLVSEAKRLTSKQGQVTELLPGGLKFKFLGGYPVWGPYNSSGPSGKYKCFYFAEGATLKDGVIEARGTAHPPYWDGYAWWDESGRGKK